MHFCFHEPKSLVLKAKTRRKVTRNYNRLSKISKRTTNIISADLVTGIKRFRSEIDLDDIHDAMMTGNIDAVMQKVPYRLIPNDIQLALNNIEGAYSLSYKYTFESLPAPDRPYRFDPGNPAIKAYIADRTSGLVDNIASEGRTVIERAVNNSFSNALSPREVASTIKDHIGLNERQSVALMNYQSKLMDRIRDPYTPERIDSMVSSYGDRLLNQRAQTIARTEARAAANYGQLSVWQQAVKSGLVERTAKKVWIVDGDPCEICEPMDGVAVGLDDLWDLNNGDSVDIPSDAHPNCFCGMELEYENAGTEEESDEGSDEGEE